MTRKTKLWLWFFFGESIPSILLWIGGFSLPDERGWYMLCFVLFSIFFAFCTVAIARDFIKQE